jgi:hypothetical protein
LSAVPIAVLVACLIVLPVERHGRPLRFCALVLVIMFALVVLLTVC